MYRRITVDAKVLLILLHLRESARFVLPLLPTLIMLIKVFPKIGKVGPLGLFFYMYFTMYYTSYLSNISMAACRKRHFTAGNDI